MDTSVSCRPTIPSTEVASGVVQLIIVDDDHLFRETLALTLIDEGYEVATFSGGSAALDHLSSGGRADVVLLDWRMPGMSGLEVLRSLRCSGNTVPVLFLTRLSEEAYEETALDGGAVDFIDKSRRPSILVRRIGLIADGVRLATVGRQPGDALRLGRLDLRFDTNRASWDGKLIDFTIGEFKTIALLALRTGEHVSYREIYDLLRGKNFAAGYGDDGYRTNVRTLIKRIRRKFRTVDPECEHIHNDPGFGYRYDWLV
jgi:two-component system, OmpR family, response regulator ChvI